ncbi:hypothetical protein CPC08DRAFT_756787 [Agrocybe pediades]|nr:hypothetical protein CPC08DRAFT_756787 [Agrocybe pediades]
MHLPGPTPSDIQSHLYSSFLQASTYDVALRVNGTWNAVYKLHRVVLIQSGFFKSLFTGGFSESVPNNKAIRNAADEISVTFADMNITRPAFEVCISRLYGGGPELYVSPNLVPTTKHPLTPAFSGTLLPEERTTGTHPATPVFLQSLLATAIYLSIPSVASQALSLILKTIGPTTVLPYLNFACGKILDIYSDDSLAESAAAVGLENVAQLLDTDDVSSVMTGRNSLLTQSSVLVNSEVNAPEYTTESLEGGDYSTQLPTHHYGSVSDKIGEACACWLTRWATDILQLEIRNATTVLINRPEQKSRGVGNSNHPVDFPLPSSSSSDICIFGRRGLPAKWVAAVVGSDTLFVKSERERYNFARSVVELRRQEGLLEEEEIIWTDMFDSGIHYEHMTFEDLHFISEDISPTTRRPYAPLSSLQRSHWTQSVLRHLILNRYSSNYSPSTAAAASSREKELGIALTTAEVLNKTATAPENSNADTALEPQKYYYPVPNDVSTRIGDNGSNTAASMEDLFSQETAQSRSSTSVSSHLPRTERYFFGIQMQRFSSQACIDFDPTGSCRWSPYPPYRFSVEFWDVDFLREKSRLHSQTVWYAGNLFNIYVQVVRKKGQAQLGIYLHRQSHVDPIPPCSASLSAVRNHKDGSSAHSTEHHPSHLRQASMPSLQPINSITSVTNHYSPSIHPPLSRSLTPSSHVTGPPSPPSSSSSSPPGTYSSFGATIPATLPSFAPQQPYRDPRSSISAYFAVSCASAIGTSQTHFSSSPDTFTVSQSWGWKSSTLRTEDFMELESQSLPHDISRGDHVSLRATVLLGLV